MGIGFCKYLPADCGEGRSEADYGICRGLGMGFGGCVGTGRGKCCRGCLLLVCWCFEVGDGMGLVSRRVLARLSVRVSGRETAGRGKREEGVKDETEGLEILAGPQNKQIFTGR